MEPSWWELLCSGGFFVQRSLLPEEELALLVRCRTILHLRRRRLRCLLRGSGTIAGPIAGTVTGSVTTAITAAVARSITGSVTASVAASVAAAITAPIATSVTSTVAAVRASVTPVIAPIVAAVRAAVTPVAASVLAAVVTPVTAAIGAAVAASIAGRRELIIEPMLRVAVDDTADHDGTDIREVFDRLDNIGAAAAANAGREDNTVDLGAITQGSET